MICFDTHILIWGVQGSARAGQEHLVERTKKYISYLEKQGARVMVPAPVVGEYLSHFNGEDLTKQKELIQRFFFVPSLDIHAASIQAEIENDRELLKKIQSESSIDRQQIRVDSQIIAVAIVNNAEKVISHDKHIHTLANGRIKVEEVPVISEQMQLDYAP